MPPHVPSTFAVLERRGYMVDRVIGQGSYGTAFLTTYKESKNSRNARRVVKAISKMENVEMILQEASLQQTAAGCMFVAELFEVLEDQAFVFLCLEACMGGHLLRRLSEMSRFTERHASKALRDLLSALSFLHSLGIVHRDVKPQNLIYESAAVDAPLKLIDFGMAVRAGADGHIGAEFAGTIHYMSPAVVAEEESDASCDIWAAGIVGYLLLSGVQPFQGTTIEGVATSILTDPVCFGGATWADISDGAVDLVARLLSHPIRARKELDPDTGRRQRGERIASADDALRHPWIEQGGPETAHLICDEVRKKLADLHTRNILDKAVSNLAAHRMRATDVDCLLRQFDRLDSSKDGFISLSEYLQGVASLEVTYKDLEQQFQDCDLDEDGRISRREFIGAFVQAGGLPDSELQDIFSRISSPLHDPRHSLGRKRTSVSIRQITASDLSNALVDLGNNSEENVLKRRAESAIAEADLDGDRALSYDEFCKWIHRPHAARVSKRPGALVRNARLVNISARRESHAPAWFTAKGSVHRSLEPRAVAMRLVAAIVASLVVFWAFLNAA